MACGCRTLLGGATYRDDCPEHSTLPPPVQCVRCPSLIGRRDPRIVTPDGPVHQGCADVRERLGLDLATSPVERAAKRRERIGRPSGEGQPVHTSPSLIRRLRRRR